MNIMPKPKKKDIKPEKKLRKAARDETPKFDIAQETKNSILGIGAFILAILSILSFTGSAGKAGDVFDVFARSLFGWGFFIVPIAFIILGMAFIKSISRKIYNSAMFGTGLFVLSILAIFFVFGDKGFDGRVTQGGYLGIILGFPLVNLVGFTASMIILPSLMLISLLVALNVSISGLINRTQEDEDYKEDKPVDVVIKKGSQVVDDKPKQILPKATVIAKPVKVEMTDKEFVIKNLKPGKWGLPPLDLLNEDQEEALTGDISASANIIKRTLGNFGIDVEMGEVSVGPTVTQFTMRPAVGVKLSRITTLGPDLSLALAAHPIRIEAPIPGKSLVGIEVPNKKVAIVGLRNMFDGDQFKKSQYFFPLALGRDVSGMPIFAGLEKMPHLLIAGATGTGKSVFMESMIRQDIENGKGACVIDPHGEFAEFVLSVIPKERIGDVIYFDPGDISRPMGLNMLEINPDHPEQKTMVIDELFEIFDKLYDLKTTGGPMFEKYFKNSALLLLDDYRYEIPVLADISRVLVDDVYRKDKLSREDNPLVREFWELEAQKAQGEQSLANMAPYISSKITSFVYNEFLRPIINQKKSALNFREAMDSRKILVVNLSKGKIGALNADLLGMILVGKLLMAALSRVDIPDGERQDFYLYIDEFQNFTTDSISTILSEARKYRLDLIIAHQFVKQLKENIRDAVFGNVGSIISFRIGPDDAEFMKNKFEPVFTPQDLISIDNLNAYVNLLIGGQTTRPFNIKVDTEKVFGAGDKELALEINKMSKLKHGRPREEVEEEIAKKFRN